MGKLNQILSIGAIMLMVAFLFLGFLRPIEVSDSWWHLKTGQWIVEHKQVPQVDPFAFDNPQPWKHTQWLGSTTLFLSSHILGIDALPILRSLFFLLLCAIIFIYGRRKIDPVILLAIIFCVAFALGLRTLLRPLIFNFLFIQLFLIHLYHFYQTKDRRQLLWVLLESIVWSNLHLGSFVYGHAIIGSFLVASLFNKERMFYAKHFLALLVGFNVMHLISPYGIDAWLHPLKALFSNAIRFYDVNVFIQEMQKPTGFFTLGKFWFWGLCVLSIWAITHSSKRILFGVLFLVGLSFYLYADRGSGFFALTSAYVVIWGLKDFKLSKVASVLLLIGVSILCVIQIQHRLGGYVIKDGSLKKIAFQTFDVQTPVDAINWMKDKKITGNLLTTDVYAGYVLYDAHPGLKPFVDGRQTDRDKFFAYLKALHRPQTFNQLDQQYSFDVALLNLSHKLSTRLVAFLNGHPNWELAYLKGSSVVFLKKGKFNVTDLPVFSDTFNLQHVDIKRVKYIDQYTEAVALIGLGYSQQGVGKLPGIWKFLPDSQKRRMQKIIQ